MTTGQFFKDTSNLMEEAAYVASLAVFVGLAVVGIFASSGAS
jgi:hypothetical protein